MAPPGSNPPAGSRLPLIAACLLAACALPAFAPPAHAQPPESISPATPTEVLEAYLSELQLREPLAAHLRQRLKDTSGEARLDVAERLGRLYARMLSEATTREARERLESLSKELLKSVPEASSFDLRINLAKAAYLPAEEVIERGRLRLSTPAELDEAQRVVRNLEPLFADMASKLDAAVKRLERQETTARDEDIEGIRLELIDSRRLRSLARYYAGWTAYYLALESRTPRLAEDALREFGAILNAVPGKPASIDRLPANMLRFEHVARAALGCALASSLTGSHVEASRWLDQLDRAENLPQSVRAQLFTRRIIIGAAANQWADVDLAVKRQRRDEQGGEKRLTIAEARLLAIAALDASRSSTLREGLRTTAEGLAQIALADLIAQGEIGHVLDLVGQFGTAPIGNDGFIVAYVRGVQAYENARAAHVNSVTSATSATAATTSAEDPTTDPAIINMYREAADLLAAAVANPDATKFDAERGRAAMRRGLALFYAGSMDEASRAFQEAASAPAAASKLREDALWYAVVSLDRAVEAGQVSLAPRRDQVAELFLRDFPASENAARLLLRRTNAQGASDAQAIEILLKLPPDSPLHAAAQRQAARLLYQAFRRAGPRDQPFAATRFAEVGERVMRDDFARSMASSDEPARQAASAVVVRVRQLADALLSMETPDLPRVEKALEILDLVTAQHPIDTREFAAEIEFRKLQMDLARGDEASVLRRLDTLRGEGGPFSIAADRLLYRTALRAWRTNTADATRARGVIRHGVRVLAEVGNAADPASVAVRDAVADAAITLWRSEQDTSMRDLARRLDEEQLSLGQRTAPSLRRLAEVREQSNENAAALDAWLELLLGLQRGTEPWFEARHESIRLLATSDPAGAQAAMAQFKVYYPDYGPPPWNEKFRLLDVKVGQPVAPPAAPRPARGGKP